MGGKAKVLDAAQPLLLTEIFQHAQFRIKIGLYGLFVGLGCKGIDLEDGVFGKKEFVRYIIVCVVSCIVCWGVLAPIGDILIYAEPANLVFIQGIFVGLSGMIASIVVGGILCKAYAASKAQKGSLTKED